VSLDDAECIQQIAIADFDTATLTNLSRRPLSTIGTVGWMAPEVIVARETQRPYSVEADVYSFGMLLFELLSLTIPYAGVTPTYRVTELILQGTPPEFPQVCPG
jgi:serine/threonine protein kinase